MPDHRAARLKSAVPGRALDHRPSHAILHASGGVRRLELGHNASRSGRHHAAELYQWRVADRVEEIHPAFGRRLKNWTSRSCFTAAARVANVPRLRRLPVLGFFESE
jgi:hypothetical protein